jgi:hypothetical protein
MMIAGRELAEGSAMPRFYGIAYYRFDMHAAVVYPIPFNIVIGFVRRLQMSFRNNNHWQTAYDKGYHQGLSEGRDFGERIAYNQTLTKEINGILSRYGQLQVKLLRKPKSEIQAALTKFTADEIDRFKMELQDR